MKLKAKAIFYLLSASLALFGCARKSADTFSVDADVARILSSFDASSPVGNIVVFDSEQRAYSLASYLAEADLFDNFTASARPDVLPDFAGEKILAIYDNGNAPYSDFLGEDGAIEAATLNSVVACADSVANAKIAILSSPVMAAYGAEYVDTVLAVTGSALPVIFPLALAVRELGKASSICVVADQEAAEAGIYEAMFGKDRVHIMQIDSTLAGGDIFIDYDAILVDDYSIAPGAVRRGAIRVVDTRELAAREAYLLMRKNNIFTHAVSYPSKSALRTDFRGDYSLYDVQD